MFVVTRLGAKILVLLAVLFTALFAYFTWTSKVGTSALLRTCRRAALRYIVATILKDSPANRAQFAAYLLFTFR